MKRYKRWNVLDPDNWDYETRTYIDEHGELITGILEGYFYFEKDDPRNDVYVENGRRK